jgi:tetratricopeptide (TPR) repeat protein
MVGITQTRIFASLLALTIGAFSVAAQEAKKEKKVKDQAEYDLLQAVNKEAAGPKKIALLEQWEQKYPDTEFKEERATVLVQTYQQMAKAPEMWTACEKLYAVNAKNPMSLFFLSQLSLSLNDASKFDKGARYTKEFLEVLPSLPGEAKDKKVQEAMARKTLGNLAMAKKDYPKAEELFTEYLKWNPNSGNVSYSLAQAMLKDKTKQMSSLWHMARAANYSGDDAMADAPKKQLQAFFEKTYVSYHGSRNGMQEVIDAALKDPFPPAGWKILSSYEQDDLEMEELKKSNEMMYNWVQMKRGLSNAQTGPQYWDGLKGTAMPKFKGKVVSSSPPVKTKEIIVGIRDANLGEVKLILEAPVGKVEPGTEIEFEGAVAKEFTAEPFLLTADIENAKVTGLPKAVGPAPRIVPKKAAAKKKG